jgi:CheY-like chemotaxis protein
MAKKILLIDDEDLIIISFHKLLTKNGYDVAVASTGMEALETAGKEDFDLVISDIKMPWVNGIETIKELKQILESKNKPLPAIIFITGFADKELEEAAKEFSPAAYMRKPVDIKDLLTTVQKALVDR